MTARYDPVFVVLSVIVAILASFAALDLAGRVRSESGATRLGWITGGATVMGLGIWSMHFVGMLAFHLPSPISYDVPLMLLSVVVAIGASLLALAVINRAKLGLRTILPAAVLMGLAIAGMHYIGMASMRMDARLSYSPSLVALSVVIAIVASLAALWLTFRFRSDVSTRGILLKILSAIVMGIAISGMHYTAMAAARFAPGHAMQRSALSINATEELGGAIVASAIAMITMALIGAVIDRSMQARSAFTRQLSERTALLEKSERQYRLIVNTALDGVVTMSEAGLITDWNAQAERMFGWSSAEAVGQRMSHMIIPQRYRDAHDRGLTHFLLTGEGPVLNTRIEITALRRDGAEFPVELSISPARLGSEWTFSAFLRDLTERDELAAALAAGEQRYLDLFEDVPTGLYRSSPGGRLIDVNPAMVSMLGYPDRASLLATPATALYVDAADRARWSAEIADAGFVRKFIVRMRRADGTEIWARESTHAKRGPDGAIVLCEGALEDITESLQSERRLQVNERRLTQILEAVPVGIFVADMSGQVILGNSAAKSILGRGAVSDLPIAEHPEVYGVYIAGTDDLYPAERTPLARALAGEVASADDIEVHRDDGVVSLSVQAAPIFDSEGAIIAAVSVFTDTTERKALEAQLRQALKMEAIGQLAGGVAHDFNNLLTVILSTGAMLLERMGPSDPTREEVQEINSAAERAAGLTRQLLAFSRKQVLQPRTMDINVAIADIENMLRRLIREDIELVTVLDPGAATINADLGQVEQVLVNLVVNARDAMPRGGRLTIATANAVLSEEIGTTAERRGGPGYVMIAVSDTGIGMSGETQRRIFDPFFTTKEPGHGTGLGLATVYGIVKQSGGDVRVRSETGRGTTFEVYLPRSGPVSRDGATDLELSAVPGGEETILLVEDDASLRALVTRVLKKYGYDVLSAESGIEALAIASSPGARIDAVVTDVVMPGMSGREVVERLQQLRPGLGYLFMSGYTDDDILKGGVLRGETEFLQKPFTPDQLARKIRDVLNRRSSEVPA